MSLLLKSKHLQCNLNREHLFSLKQFVVDMVFVDLSSML